MKIKIKDIGWNVCIRYPYKKEEEEIENLLSAIKYRFRRSKHIFERKNWLRRLHKKLKLI